MRFDKSLLRIVVSLCLSLTCLVGIAGSTRCGKRQYKSDFLSGGCAGCPDTLQKCDDQELNDSIRCFKACRRWPPLFTSPPTLDYTSTPKATELPTQTNLKPSELNTKTDRSTSKNSKSFVKFRNSLDIYTSSDASNGRHSGQKDMTRVIVIGMIVALVAVPLVLIGVSVAIFLKRRRDSISAEPPTAFYAAVALDSKSNSDESLALETVTKTDDAQSEFDGTSTVFSSISFECLAAVKVSNV